MQPTCTLCGSASCQFLFSRSDHETVKVARPFSYHACLRCGAHYQGPSDLPEDLYLEEKNNTVPPPPDGRHYVHWDDDVVRSIQGFVPGGRLLDFGSGYGDLLIAAAQAGYSAEGADVSPVFAREARERSGCPVFEGDLRKAGYPDGHFDVINAHFVLEYVPDLLDTFAEISRILAPGGLLRICSYTTDSLPARVKGARWWNYTSTRRYLLSRRTIDFLAASGGLRVAREVHGGERSLASHARERPGAGGLRARARHVMERAHVGPLSLTSRRAFYLRHDRAGDGIQSRS